jgi:hypothetical protein
MPGCACSSGRWPHAGARYRGCGRVSRRSRSQWLHRTLLWDRGLCRRGAAWPRHAARNAQIGARREPVLVARWLASGRPYGSQRCVPVWRRPSRRREEIRWHLGCGFNAGMPVTVGHDSSGGGEGSTPNRSARSRSSGRGRRPESWSRSRVTSLAPWWAWVRRFDRLGPRPRASLADASRAGPDPGRGSEADGTGLRPDHLRYPRQLRV